MQRAHRKAPKLPRSSSDGQLASASDSEVSTDASPSPDFTAVKTLAWASRTVASLGGFGALFFVE